ncbi:anhydro-N-acetylmuramic acid kinase [Pseudoduganella buxea]|uniref:Anhydro-N-acetylmuramic acid kinase n=1 Tax=Pseudoduganella buxea TaxID=1949069 RepID=A0A6I3T4D8_9BURK|nr:anhydro-N-acetylmuramic acid kinase [Pseudoduganella buxea]MTV55596.1 anhydro-N-acetylmuramic acid kinase [Pseudoduganella buxea]GGB90936.1 anhydro-N-acetylmuramic acid kinase [Pseudoduganella buxea]
MSLFIGLMSGTSLDGVDGVLVDFWAGAARTLSAAHVAYPAALREELMALQAATPNELEREALAARQVALVYADCIEQVLAKTEMKPADVRAVGAHGQTIRHRPELGFTWQTLDASLLAELSGIDVIADFRSRDVAAGGQGAPLVPAAHHALFGQQGSTRVLANIGGIANISVLHPDGHVTGFDTGPGNVLMDLWIDRHLGRAYDDGGAWAAGGHVIPGLLSSMLLEPYFAAPVPKSTGRDLFHQEWLQRHVANHGGAAPQDVMATLTRLTAVTLANAIKQYAAGTDIVYLCGGGAYNDTLKTMLAAELGHQVTVETTAALGVVPEQMEALCWAWLAFRFDAREPGNLPSVTGAKGLRVLGALHPR